MGPRTVAEFVTNCNASYVLNCLDRGISSTRFSGSALEALARRTVIKARRDLSMDKDEARRLFDQVEILGGLEVPNETWHHNDLLTDIFGEEWWHTSRKRRSRKTTNTPTCFASSRQFRRR